MNATEPPSTNALSLTKIRPGSNPRRYFDKSKHDELVASFRVRGMLQPILLRPAPDADDIFTIVAGERRYKAALEAFGPEGEVLVLIRDMTDQEALEAAIDENDNRDDASETEQADAAVRALAACQGDRAEAARRLAWSPAKLARRLALANLSDAAKAALDERLIKVGHAELLAAVPADKQDKALDNILTAGLDVARTRAALMRMTQELATATFDKEECATCPFSSAHQAVLFDTHVDDGHCTNPGCFQLKTETADKARIAEEERIAAAAKPAQPPADDDTPPEPTAVITEPAADTAPTTGKTATPAKSPAKPATRAAAAQRPELTASSIAGRSAGYREAAWRSAVARALSDMPDRAYDVFVVAALSGALSRIKPETLTDRAALLMGTTFPELDFRGKIAAVGALSDDQAGDALSAIGAACAKDALGFDQVTDLVQLCDVDLRDSWQVDRAFLEQFNKDELRFIARECGLVAHMGEKAFAKLLDAKGDKLVTGMLHATGFDWAGRLPGAVTLDGQYGPPPTAVPPAAGLSSAAPEAEAAPAEPAGASTDSEETATDPAPLATEVADGDDPASSKED